VVAYLIWDQNVEGSIPFTSFFSLSIFNRSGSKYVFIELFIFCKTAKNNTRSLNFPKG
jgi:hypothetical protein